MLYLLFSVCASVTVSILLKLVRNTNISLPQIIFWNYPVAALLAYFIAGSGQIDFQVYLANNSWILLALLGILFPSVFIFMGKAAQNVGIVKADIAQRLSLIFGVSAAFLLFNDVFTPVKGAAIVISFLAIFCLMDKGKAHSYRGLSLDLHRQQYAQSRYTWLWILLVWVGYGVIDILLKYMAVKNFINTLVAIFIVAAILMFIYLLFSRARFNLASLITGAILGCLNFTNIYFYLQAHRAMANQTALVMTTMNLGVVVLATILGTMFLRERVSKVNILGILLAIVAIITLGYGDQILAQLLQADN
ncbi:DMT family transporter [Psittacicella hinzii]|uniref:EamA domain-containing protein n=1 Tax=Psittacicella hinzii TaxID=2028575 RepID=A0A3A1YPJ0_9GAMM|nr:DMT family transporter [Psittacicella hinzii]RIY39461.1 hypothetical protein CKF58_02220 [Psittacicella hinzii]